MRNWQHGPCLDYCRELRQYLYALARRLEPEPGAASAAHSQRVPADEAVEGVVLLQEHDQHLIRRRSVGRASGRRHDPVGMLAIRNHGCIPDEGNASALRFDSTNALAYVATALPFGCRRGQQQLLGTKATQQALVP